MSSQRSQIWTSTISTLKMPKLKNVNAQKSSSTQNFKFRNELGFQRCKFANEYRRSKISALATQNSKINNLAYLISRKSGFQKIKFSSEAHVGGLWMLETCGSCRPVDIADLWKLETCASWRPVDVGDLWTLETFGRWRPVEVGDLWKLETCGGWRYVDAGDMWTLETCGRCRNVYVADLWTLQKCVRCRAVDVGDLWMEVGHLSTVENCVWKLDTCSHLSTRQKSTYLYSKLKFGFKHSWSCKNVYCFVFQRHPLIQNCQCQKVNPQKCTSVNSKTKFEILP